MRCEWQSFEYAGQDAVIVNAELVWQIIAAASALGAIALWFTLWWLIPARRRFGGIWRWFLVAVIVLFFALPAPVPNYSDAEAPAFIVMIFETFFQRSGAPEESMRRLLSGTVVLLLMSAGWWLLRRVIKR